MKVALYARVSIDGQDPEVQLIALRAHAAQRDWQVVEELVDRGVSGARERRPALDRLLKAAWAGCFQVVLVWRFDRFALCRLFRRRGRPSPPRYPLSQRRRRR